MKHLVKELAVGDAVVILNGSSKYVGYIDSIEDNLIQVDLFTFDMDGELVSSKDENTEEGVYMIAPLASYIHLNGHTEAWAEGLEVL